MNRGMESLAYGSLHDALVALQRDVDSYHEAVQRFVTHTAEAMAQQDGLVSELRDDLHAVANRVEALTRAV